MIIPEFLKPGDTIGIAATARSVTPEQIEAAVTHMEMRGFKIHTAPELFHANRQFSDTDQGRAKYFNHLINNPEIKAVWCARGGYGTARMIDMVDSELFKHNPKWIAGFSDVTVLHSHIGRNCNTATLHASMPVFMHQKTGQDLSDVQIAFDSLADALYGNFRTFDLSRNEGLHKADFEGRIVGGNLSVLYSILGSRSEENWEGKILFLEDLDEYLYHIDRMVLGLKRSGRLKGLKALLIGSFIAMHDHQIPFGYNVREIIAQHCSEYGYPIIFDVDAGHHLRNNCIPLGMHAEFKSGILKFAAG